jgi:hypothetical protein
MNMETLARVRADLESLIDANNDVENTATHASEEFKTAQSRGNDLRNAVRALRDIA